MMVGSALQLAIMAVAMSERMNWLREDLERQRHRLEEQVDERRLELAKAHANLTKSQKQLAQSERMAALGDMVAGIAHEINTPIGIGITASSRMDEVIRDLENHLAQNTLKKSSLVGGLQTLREAEDIILNNLQRAAELIMSFKQVSADQASGTMRTFDLGHYTRDILRGLETKIKRSNVEVEQSIAEKIRIFRTSRCLRSASYQLGSKLTSPRFSWGGTMARLKSLRPLKMEPLRGFTKTMGTVSQKNSRSAYLSRSIPPRVSEGERAWV